MRYLFFACLISNYEHTLHTIECKQSDARLIIFLGEETDFLYRGIYRRPNNEHLQAQINFLLFVT